MSKVTKPTLHQQNEEYLVLATDNGQEVEFEQIATIPLDGQVYTILLPLKPFEGFDCCEGLVFVHQQANGQDRLAIVTDEDIIDGVFEIYNQLFDEAFGQQN